MPAVATERRSFTLSLPIAWRTDPVPVIKTATAVNVVVTVLALVLICGVSEDWWLSAALSYLPRAPYLAFSLAILPAVIWRNWIMAIVNLLCAATIAGPVMGLSAPLGEGAPAATSDSMLVVSCNAQNGGSDLQQLFAELDALQPDVIAFQETTQGYDEIASHFDGWHIVDAGEFCAVARYPLRLIDQCDAESTQRKTAIACEIDVPGGACLLCDIHLSTARHGLTQLRWHSPLTGAGVDDLRWRQWERRLESEETLRFVAAHVGEPTIALGDFNTPTTSTLFADIWGGGEWQSAFETAGWGYGFTSPCNTGRLWPSNTPWLRIDHILADANWQFHAAGIGRSAGSDHRLIWARMSRR